MLNRNEKKVKSDEKNIKRKRTRTRPLFKRRHGI